MELGNAMKLRNTTFILFILILFSALSAELKAPLVDKTEKPGQRKLDNVIRSLPANGAGPELLQQTEEVSVSALVIKTVFGLLFIVVLIVVLVYLMKKLQGGKFNRLTQGTDIEILEVAPLGQHQKIVSVKIQSKIMVLGVTQQTINTLTTLEGEDAQRYLMSATQTGITSGQFSQTVNQLLSKFKREPSSIDRDKGPV